MKSASLAAAASAVAIVLVLAILAGHAAPALSAEAAAAPPANPPTPAAKPAATGTAASAAAPKHAAPAEPPVALVNGVPISRTVFEYYVKTATHKNLSDLPPEAKSQLLDNLIRGELLSQQATKEGLEKKEEIQSQISLTRVQVLGEAEATSYLKDKPPTDAQVHAEYDAAIASMPKTEYHARHILVPTQGDAQFVIDQLKGGASFEELAKTKSTDSSKDQGGDLGWFAAQTMVKPFADAVVALKKGETTQTPVQSPFGWHVIQLLDTRDQAPPQFDAVKQRVQQLVQEKKIRAYQDELMKTATIKKNL
jgi:peptidyl-prolyl cis-trans isomerase C